MPVVSVIIPVYKVEKYLKRCLDSLLSQSFSDWQAICVDDGSPDKSPKILDEYAARDSRFKVIHKKNQGVSSARNDGIKNADGKYIHFLDADDYMIENAYELLYRKASELHVDMLKAKVYRIDEKTKEIQIQKLLSQIIVLILYML